MNALLRSSVALFSLILLIAPLSAAEPPQLRILSYNIHHGEGVDGKLDLERIAGIIAEAKPDLVALQEVDQNTSRSGNVDQPARLAELTGMTVLFEKNIEFGGGEYGNAVLSRFPVPSYKNVLLPNVNGGEQRGVLIAKIQVPGIAPQFTFLATHLDHRGPDEERLASATKINALGEEVPAILAGDLNDAPDSASLDLFRIAWSLPPGGPYPTIPAARPQRQIDFVLFRPADAWKVVRVNVLDEPAASDHRPILVVLQYAAE